MAVHPRTGDMYDPPAPGHMITATYLEPLKLSARELADILDVAPSTLNRVLNGRSRITPDMALRLEKALGQSAQSWLKMQNIRDMWVARQTVDLSRVRSLDTRVA